MIFISIALNIILLVLLYQAKSELKKMRSAKIKIENLRKDTTSVPLLKLTVPDFMQCKSVDFTRIINPKDSGLFYDDNMNPVQRFYFTDSYCVFDYMKVNAINKISVFGNTWVNKERIDG